MLFFKKKIPAKPVDLFELSPISTIAHIPTPVDAEFGKEMESLLKEVPKELPDLPPAQIPTKVDDQEIVAVAKHQGLKWGFKRKLKKNPTKSYLITMIYGNSSCNHFVGIPNANGFIKHRKKLYHINQKLCVWDANENNNRVYFHENYVEPLEIKEVTVDGAESPSYMTYVTPENVGPVIRMESVRLIAEGPDLQKWLRITTFVSIAVLCILVIILIVFIAQSGIFAQLSQGLRGAVGGATA
jgi:hypothetical protein